MKHVCKWVLFSLVFLAAAQAPQDGPRLRFEVTIPETIREEPATGRVFVMVSHTDEPGPRLQVGYWWHETPLFAKDVEGLGPGEAAVIDADALGFPLSSLAELPRGEYYVQALLNVYTQCERSDGRTVWVHLDRWEGQQFNKSPGNLYSDVQKVRLDPATGPTVRLSLDRTIPPIEIPPDTEWVKRLKFRSDILSDFWGQPISIGATVLLPKGYDDHPEIRYPVIYVQGHFGLNAPFRFPTKGTLEEEEVYLQSLARVAGITYPSGRKLARQSAFDFKESWLSDGFPRMIAVTFQHPTPYFDDSYAVNSENNGPYGDAVMQELIPHLEESFRILRQPYARVLTGGSTGGWESLALQVYHPRFFGGTWTFYPDPVDFRRYCLIDLYQDDNAFRVPGFEWFQPERYFRRDPSGQPLVTMRQLSRMEAVFGSKGRSGQQLDIWQATFGPVGDDGYPRPLWNKLTGEIDHEVARFMKDQGYDLRHYVETHWPEIGPHLVGKLHIYCGDMDDYYLNEATYLLEGFLKSTKDPYYDGTVEYGRPQKGHGWHPMDDAELVRMMAEHITSNAPPDADSSAWKYD